jgi:monofunctional biosynthetic peptidoglycan transglycosylase
MRWIVGLGLAAAAVVGTGWYLTLPDVSRLAHENPSKTALMLDRERHGVSGRAIWVPLERISPTLQYAVIVAEDAGFYGHRGVDWREMWEAIRQNLHRRRLYRGASTITQQLAKNLYLDSHKTLWRKLQETVLAVRMERALAKSRILEIYLNVAEWGHGVYGAEAAARRYFGKSAADLTLEESSWLAAILPSPLRYGKDSGSTHLRERTERIAHLVESRYGVARVSLEPPSPIEAGTMEPPAIEAVPAPDQGLAAPQAPAAELAPSEAPVEPAEGAPDPQEVVTEPPPEALPSRPVPPPDPNDSEELPESAEEPAAPIGAGDTRPPQDAPQPQEGDLP